MYLSASGGSVKRTPEPVCRPTRVAWTRGHARRRLGISDEPSIDLVQAETRSISQGEDPPTLAFPGSWCRTIPYSTRSHAWRTCSILARLRGRQACKDRLQTCARKSPTPGCAARRSRRRGGCTATLLPKLSRPLHANVSSGAGAQRRRWTGEWKTPDAEGGMGKCLTSSLPSTCSTLCYDFDSDSTVAMLIFSSSTMTT